MSIWSKRLTTESARGAPDYSGVMFFGIAVVFFLLMAVFENRGPDYRMLEATGQLEELER